MWREDFTCATHYAGFGQDEWGATAIEYGLIAALIAIAIIAALNLLSGNLKNTFNYVGTQLAGATTN